MVRFERASVVTIAVLLAAAAAGIVVLTLWNVRLQNRIDRLKTNPPTACLPAPAALSAYVLHGVLHVRVAKPTGCPAG